MITRFRTLSALRNSGTRIYASGADPKFRRPLPPATFRLVPAFSPEEPVQPAKEVKLWEPGRLDRWESAVTRRPE
jgi:hypothetical protein